MIKIEGLDQLSTRIFLCCHVQIMLCSVPPMLGLFFILDRQDNMIDKKARSITVKALSSCFHCVEQLYQNIYYAREKKNKEAKP